MSAHPRELFEATADMDPAEHHQFIAKATANDQRQIETFDSAIKRGLVRPTEPEAPTFAWLFAAAAGLGLIAGLLAAL